MWRNIHQNFNSTLKERRHNLILGKSFCFNGVKFVESQGWGGTLGKSGHRGVQRSSSRRDPIKEEGQDSIFVYVHNAHCIAQPTPLFRVFASFDFSSSPNGVGKTSLHSFGSQLFLFLVFTTRSDAVISLDRKCGFVLSQNICFVSCSPNGSHFVQANLTFRSDIQFQL